MQAVDCTSPHNTVELDVCTTCQFVWFDAGELAQLPPAKQLSKKAEQMVRALELDLERDRPRSAVAKALNRPVSAAAMSKIYLAAQLIDVASEVLEAELAMLDPPTLAFDAGQWVSVPFGPKTVRAYSIASTPRRRI